VKCLESVIIDFQNNLKTLKASKSTWQTFISKNLSEKKNLEMPLQRFKVGPIPIDKKIV
jgi:hypothetical protein